MADDLTAKELVSEELILKESSAEGSTAEDQTAEVKTAGDQNSENRTSTLSTEEPNEDGDCNSTAAAKVELPIAPRRPLVLDGDPSYSTCIDRPLIISGQVIGITAMLGAFFWVLTSVLASASAPIATTTFQSIWKLFIHIVGGGLIAFYVADWLLGWLRLRKAAVFVVALYDPLFRLLKLIPLRGLAETDILSIRGFAKFLRCSNHFAEAAACYSQALSSLSPLSTERLKYERFYAFSLFYDGQTDRAIQYSDALVNYWQAVTDDVIRTNTVRSLGYAVYTSATLYYLVGDKESACRLQHALYKKAKKVPSYNEAQTIAMLCEGQALLSEEKFENARSLLSDCCESLRWNTPNDLKMAIHQAYALSLAHCDDKALALNQLEVAARYCSSDDERLSNALAKIEIFKMVNELENAKATITETFEKLHPLPESFMFECLSKAAESIGSPQLLSSRQPVTKPVLAKSSEHSIPDLPAQNDRPRELPSQMSFRNFTGLGIVDAPLAVVVISMGYSDYLKAAADTPLLYAFLVLFVCLRIYQCYWGQRKGAAAKAKLNDARRVTYFARLDRGAVILIDPVEVKDVRTVYANTELAREVNRICGQDIFTVTVFERGEIPIAIEILGCYSSVSSSPYMP